MSNAPLDGIKVVIFGTGVVIPDFGKIMGEFGADVIKIESNENLDFMRTISADPNNSQGFNESNRNAKSFGVNLNTDKGREIVKELIKNADIVGDNFRGGVVKKLGFGYESVREFNPDIVYISSQGFGGGGPNSDYKAYGPMLAAFSGVLSLWAHPDDEYPAGANFPHPDHIASKQATVAVLAALDYRRRTGKGQFIDMSQIESAACLIGESYLDYTINKRVQKPTGNRSAHSAPHGCYRCKGHDQWCAICVDTEDEWQNLCNVMGMPELVNDTKFANLTNRLKNVDELEKIIEAWTINFDPEVVMHMMQSAGVAAGMAQRAVDTIADPQLKHDNAIVEVDHPVAGNRLYPNMPWSISNMEFCESAPAPIIGQHTEEICRDVLNISQDDINRLTEEKILEIPAEPEVPEEQET